MENPTELRTQSSIAQQGYLVNTIEPEHRKGNMKPQYLCAVFADGGRVAFNKSRESGRKDKMRVRFGGQVSEMQLTAGKDKMRGKMVATDWCWPGSLEDVKGSRLNEGTLVNQSFSFWF